MSGKWGQLKEKCQKFLGARGGTGIPKAVLCENMRGSTGVDPNLTEQQWKDFEKAFLTENNNLRRGCKHTHTHTHTNTHTHTHKHTPSDDKSPTGSPSTLVVPKYLKMLCDTCRL